MYALAVAPQNGVSAIECRDVENAETLHSWRKHHDLHGWMEQLYFSKGGTELFNGEVIELTDKDLDNLTTALDSHQLPPTTGFFFGQNPPNERSNMEDKSFIANARAAIQRGFKVYYTSSW